MVALGIAALPTAAPASGLADLDPAAVAAMIDVTSFPNSIESREDEGLRTFVDYGFTKVEVVNGQVRLYEDDGSWMFALTVLERRDDRLVLCMLDKALGGPTYDAQVVLAFASGDGGLLVATGEDSADDRCPERP
jgi:hypothetical protein